MSQSQGLSNRKAYKEPGAGCDAEKTSPRKSATADISSSGSMPVTNGLARTQPHKLLDRDQFLYDNEWDEPHERRRRAIMLKYGPRVKQLIGICSYVKWHCLLLVAAQVSLAYLLKDTSNALLFVAVAYFIGGTLNCACSVGLHEISHFTAFESPLLNRLLSFILNLPLTVPAAASFRYYHMEHHSFQGVDGYDVDLATTFEGKYLQSRLLKFLNVCFFWAQYAFRPMLIRPKAITIWIAINFVIQVAFNVAMWKFVGPQALGYLALSTLLGLGPHPCAGHFISEHFCADDGGQETYSYYGPLNFIMFNVGYHNEHHDFPRVPFTRLPALRKIAPEFYDNLKTYDSWTSVLYNFVMTAGFGHFNRVKRTLETHKEAKKKWRMSMEASKSHARASQLMADNPDLTDEVLAELDVDDGK